MVPIISSVIIVSSVSLVIILIDLREFPMVGSSPAVWFSAFGDRFLVVITLILPVTESFFTTTSISSKLGAGGIGGDGIGA